MSSEKFRSSPNLFLSERSNTFFKVVRNLERRLAGKGVVHSLNNISFVRPFTIQQAVEKRPSAAFPSPFPLSKHGAGLLQRTSKYASGRLTNSSAWQDVAPYSSRRHSQDCLPDRQVKGAAGARKRDFEDSTCIRAFLTNLKKVRFPTDCQDMTSFTVWALLQVSLY
jgi:hypothetical protein